MGAAKRLKTQDSEKKLRTQKVASSMPLRLKTIRNSCKHEQLCGLSESCVLKREDLQLLMPRTLGVTKNPRRRRDVVARLGVVDSHKNGGWLRLERWTFLL